jgi:hypothetical protein
MITLAESHPSLPNHSFRKLVADQFRLQAEGKFAKDAIERTAQKIVTLTAAYESQATLFGPVLQVIKMAGKSGIFNGDAAPILGAAGAWQGHIYTDDENRLVNDTIPQSFQLNIAVVYCSVLFFDHQSELLGHFQGGGLSFAAGIAGGQGRWSGPR